MRVVPGAIVDYYADGEVVAGVVMSEEKGRVRVVTETGREDRIAPARILAAYEGILRTPTGSGAGNRPEASRVDAAHSLAAAHARSARERRGPLEIALVWEILVDEGGERRLDELAELATGERGAIACAAVLRELLEEKVYFSRRADLWEPRSRDSVAEVLRQRERERLRREERERLVARMRDAMSGGARFERSGGDEETRVLAALETMAVQGEAPAPLLREAQSLIADLGIRAPTPELGAFEALKGIGLFSEHENLFIRRFGMRVDFPAGAAEEAVRVVGEAAGGPDGPGRLERQIAAGARRDLRDLAAFSVDDELTSEIDDALTVEPLGGGRYLAGIHIADPGFYVRPGGDLDRVAESRAVTFYLPERRVLMLPPPISEDAASLLPGASRPSLSFFATLDEAGTLLDWRIEITAVRSRRRVTYEEAGDAVRASGDPAAGGLDPDTLEQLRGVHRLAAGLESARIAAGAHVIRAPEVDLRVGPDGTVVLKRMEADDPGRLLVSEMMILASRIAALYCLERGVPCIYRRQPPAEDSVPPVTAAAYDPVAVRKARRGLRRGESGLIPGRHYALGLDAYAQATSPLRRYQDLVIHRQIHSTLSGAPPCYDTEGLQRIVALTDEAERIARLAERGSDEYWTLRYLEARKGQTVEGVVVAVDRRRVEVELKETLYTTSIPPRPDHQLGQALQLVIEDVSPRMPGIRLRQLD